MANVRVQMEFRMGADGWSEVLYAAGSSPKGFKASAEALKNARLKCLVKVAEIHHVRISLVGGGSRSYRFPCDPSSGKIAAPRDAGATTIVVGMYGETGAYRTYKFHGSRDVDSRYNNDGTPGTTLQDIRKTYLQYLKDNQFMIRHLNVAANADGLATVHGITITDGIATAVLTGTVPDGTKKIIISGMKGYNVSQFNGVWTVGNKVVTLGVTSLQISSRRPVDTRFSYLPDTGNIRIGGTAAYGFQKIDDWDDFESISSRKTGRPTDEHRGRRSSRR